MQTLKLNAEFYNRNGERVKITDYIPTSSWPWRASNGDSWIQAAFEVMDKAAK